MIAYNPGKGLNDIPILSIIIPVHNVEKYLDDCIQCIVNQSFENFEVILIDDGSTDGSGKICDEWTEKDGRIRVCHQKNAGVSAARNQGLVKALGTTVLFLDADDTILPGMFEDMLHRLSQDESDAVCCGYHIENREVSHDRSPGDKIVSGEDAIKDMLISPLVFTSVWNKIFKKSVLFQNGNYVQFSPNFTIGEDTIWLVQVFHNCKKVSYISGIYYRYIIHSGGAVSALGQRIDESALSEIPAYDSVRTLCTAISPQCYNVACWRYNSLLISKLFVSDSVGNTYISDVLLKKLHAGMIDFKVKTTRDLKLWIKTMAVFIFKKLHTPKSFILWAENGFKFRKRKLCTAYIFTIYDVGNYGNRLQNYAVQTILGKFGITSTSVSTQKRLCQGKLKAKHFIHRLTRYHLTHNTKFWRNLYSRRLSFLAFEDKHVRTKHIRSLNEIKDADYYAVGSDQVWNPTWYTEGDLKKDMFFLTFAKPEQKVCFSPSFGVSSLPTEWTSWYKEYLSSFPFLSAREADGVKLIKELTGKDAELTLDPTLMLSKAEWESIATQPRRINCDKKYILTYFLGELPDERKVKITTYAQELDASVYAMSDESQPELYSQGPAEFLYLISKAELILTDSFHACVFSFILQRPFLVFDRKGENDYMFSRIETFLKTFRLERKYEKSGIANTLTECDYTEGYAVLAEEQKKTFEFLRKSLRL